MRVFRRASLFLLIPLLILAIYHGIGLARVGFGYKAKVLCSALFVSKRSIDSVLQEDLSGLLRFFPYWVNNAHQTVSTGLFRLPFAHAEFRKDLGCTLTKTTVPLPTLTTAVSRPPSLSLPRTLNPELDQVLDLAFSETSSHGPVRTRAVLIWHQDRIVAERYAPNIEPQTPLLGWSMTKSVLHALIGIRIRQSKLTLSEQIDTNLPNPKQSQVLKQVTLDELLHMESGLCFDERGGPYVSDLTRMLFMEKDMAAFAQTRGRCHAPHTHWSYASGTSNLLSRRLAQSFNTLEDYWRFPYEALFAPLGMSTAVFETDASGHFVASSYLYASAEDWLRFGILYLGDGLWQDQRLLPQGWVTHAATPTSRPPKGEYGSHFWTNGRREQTQETRPFPKLPPDMFYASGYESQYLVIIPSHHVVILRMGQTPNRKSFDLAPFVSGVLEALKSPPH